MEILLSCLHAWEVANKVLNNPEMNHEAQIEIIRELDFASGYQCNFHHVAGYP